MYYNGKEMNLAEYVAAKKKEWEGMPKWMWEHEGIVYAIMDYHSSMGEFTKDDWNTLNELLMEDVGHMCMVTE